MSPTDQCESLAQKGAGEYAKKKLVTLRDTDVKISVKPKKKAAPKKPKKKVRAKRKPKVIEKTRVAYFLVGIPGSGKTTFREDLRTMQPSTTGYAVISTDDYIEEVAKTYGVTYDSIFSETIGVAAEAMNHYFTFAIERDMDIIIDRTNVKKSSRAFYLGSIPKHYAKIAVVVETPPDEILFKRLAGRPGKAIPTDVISDMRKKYEEPTVDEGFDQIVRVSGWRDA